MGRSAADKRFGWRREGILRILTAADPGAVLEAITDLGLVIPEEISLADLSALKEELLLIDVTLRNIETSQAQLLDAIAAHFRRFGRSHDPRQLELITQFMEQSEFDFANLRRQLEALERNIDLIIADAVRQLEATPQFPAVQEEA